MSGNVDRKLVELLEDERAVHGGRFFDAGYYMALDYVIERDVPHTEAMCTESMDREKFLLDVLSARKVRLKDEHSRLKGRNGPCVCESVGPSDDFRKRKMVRTADLGAESFVAGQLAGVEKAMEIAKGFVKVAVCEVQAGE